MSNLFVSSAERASSAEETQLIRGGWLKFNPRYSWMILSESLQSSSMIQASYRLETKRISLIFLAINSWKILKLESKSSAKWSIFKSK
jgi:hypothetical protein